MDFRRAAVAPLAFMFCFGRAEAAGSWTCNMGASDTTPTMTSRYDVENGKLLAYEHAASDAPDTFDIVEDTADALIAIRHSPSRLTLLMIDRRRNAISEELFLVASTYRERYVGSCVEK